MKCKTRAMKIPRQNSILLSIMISVIATVAFSQVPFVTTWQTDNEGASCNSCITIPTRLAEYSYEVDWDGDGVYDESGITGDVSHDFGVAGTYTISIRGLFPSIFFNNRGDRLKLLSVDQWGDNAWEQFTNAFSGCQNFDIVATDVPDLSKVTTLYKCFSNCSSLTRGCADWDVSNVLVFAYMFEGCSNFNEDIGSWNVSNGGSMDYMFFGASSFNQDIGSWDVSNNIVMTGVFAGAQAFNQDISLWDVSNVEYLAGIFSGASTFDQDIGSWDVSNVEYMPGMFKEATAFNQDISSWDLSSVRHMAHMFDGAISFDQPIGSWDVSRSENMLDMFRNAKSFNQDLSSWDISNVVFVQGMFQNATAFDQDLGSWSFDAVQYGLHMLDSCGMSCENYTGTLQGWAANEDVPDSLYIGVGNMKYGGDAIEARTLLLDKGWNLIGDIEVLCTTNTEYLEVVNFSTYPNPASDVLYTNSVVKGQYSIRELSGALVQQGALHHGEVDITNLRAGIYLLTVEINDKTFTSKFVRE